MFHFPQGRYLFTVMINKNQTAEELRKLGEVLCRAAGFADDADFIGYESDYVNFMTTNNLRVFTDFKFNKNCVPYSQLSSVKCGKKMKHLNQVLRR